MITIPDLQTALLDLLHEVEGTEIRPIIGGGYGIYLRTEHVRRLDVRTLLREWPEPRSTNDLDLFLRPELLIHSAKLKPLAGAIARLGYQVVPGAEKYQFVKPGPGGHSSRQHQDRHPYRAAEPLQRHNVGSYSPWRSLRLGVRNNVTQSRKASKEEVNLAINRVLLSLYPEKILASFVPWGEIITSILMLTENGIQCRIL
jgi:hypothetical protein